MPYGVRVRVSLGVQNATVTKLEERARLKISWDEAARAGSMPVGGT